MFTTIAQDSIVLQYQPVARCGGEVVGFEALMRWHHRQRGSISPEAFIPVFESSGLIVPLSQWALKQACEDAMSWSQPLSVSVNLSAVQFQEDDLPALIRSVLGETGLPSQRLDVELTEDTLLADPHKTLDVLEEVAALGIAVVLDDFGVGACSPSCLKDFPFSRVKIDGSLIASMDQSAMARSIVHMIVDLGHSLGIAVVAEGVETDAQLSYLQSRGCDLVQGFLIGHPAPIAAFGDLTGNMTKSSFVEPDQNGRHFAATESPRALVANTKWGA